MWNLVAFGLIHGLVALRVGQTFFEVKLVIDGWTSAGSCDLGTTTVALGYSFGPVCDLFCDDCSCGFYPFIEVLLVGFNRGTFA